MKRLILKRLILIFAVFQLMNFALLAQTSPTEIEQLKQINQEVVTNYKTGKFDDALKAARQALDLTIKIFGAENRETATSYTNLGEIYRAKKKFDEAAENFQKALAIYQLKSAQNADRIARVSESLGIILVLDGKEKQGEELLSQSVITAENAFGKESKEVLPYLKSLSEFYIYIKKPNQAQPFFIRRYLTSSKFFQPQSKELQEIEDDFTCFSYQNFSRDELDERQKQFYEAVKNVKKGTAEPVKSVSTVGTIKSGVINGKALSLPHPEYPASARARFAQGVIPVRVEIDEKGQVISTKALCGDPDLRIVSEEAAKRAKFAPTLLSGIPVKVSGIIVYNFVR